MRGVVVRNTGSWYTVKTDDGRLVESKIKGNFRLKGIRSTNPVAVGDHVNIAENAEGTAFITAIDDRRNYIIRKSQNLSKQSHILAANVDQACLVVTVKRPQTSTTFVDRFLASAEAYRVPVILIFNKTDLLDEDERRYQQMMVTLYETIGYECHEISAVQDYCADDITADNEPDNRKGWESVEALFPLLKDKVTLLSGNSGVGKSTMMNLLIPEAHQLPEGGYVIDTPGIKGFGTFDMEPEEISGYFKEIFRFSSNCRFNNCTHTHEPGCAVRKAVEEHYIAESRYQSYLSMLEDKEEGKYREAY